MSINAFFIPILLIKKEEANDEDLLNRKRLEEKNRVCYIEEEHSQINNVEETKNRNNRKERL